PVTTGGGNKYNPTWSTDGNFIIYSGEQSGQRDLFYVPVDGSEAPVNITNTPNMDETAPDFSPIAGVGTAPILFVRSAAGEGSKIWRIGLLGDGEEQVSNGGGDPLVNDVDPSWRHNGQMIAFASDRLQAPEDTRNDYNIWTMPAAGEVGPGSSILRSNLDVDDTYDDRYPAFNPGLNRSPVRIFFTSWRADAFGPEPDIWRVEATDSVGPELQALPWVEQRELAPGGTQTVYVSAFDRDSGIGQIVASFKDPDSAEDDSQGIDHKQFDQRGGFERYFNNNFDGIAFVEVDCDTVGQIELFDDGDPANGDAVAGDGIFSGTWDTPMSPSDYIIDITASDAVGNTILYDDVYGFTTQAFQPSTNVLFVNDYCEGQTFPSALGWNNDSPTAFPVESYYTTNPGFVPATDSDPPVGNIAFNTFRDGINGNGRLGEPYDIWRVICRGPIAMSDLLYYLPTKETQLEVPSLTGSREVLVANRAVVWAAPHTGDVWASAGSIIDPATQATVSTFLSRGGRLMISGQDIGFALTLDGTVSNNFYTNYLHASYVNDDNHSGDTTINGVGGDPVAQDPWGGNHYPEWADGGPDAGDYPLEMHMPYDFSLSNHDGWNDAADAIEWPDGIAPIGGAIQTHSYAGGPGAGVRYTDPINGYRVVYFAFDFTSIHREYHATSSGSTSIRHCQNYRSKLMHQVLCWLRTGGFQGRVISISDGGRPVNDPPPIVRISGGGYQAAVECEEDGRYVIGGVPPGGYSVAATRPGFDIDHSEVAFTHGGLNYPIQDFAISRAQPGAIAGTVTSLATGDPLATVQVCAYEALLPEDDDDDDQQPAQVEEYERGALIGCDTTAVDGTFTIADVPPGTVIVEADGSAQGYGTDQAVVTVEAGNTTNVDLALTAAPGQVAATVTDTDDNPLVDATVEIMSGGAVVASGQTDANGEVTIDVQPGAYTVEASRSGYQSSDPEGIDVEAAESVDVTLTLQSEPPGSLSGLIARGLTGEPVGGMTVELVVSGSVLDTTTTTATTQNAGDGTPFNYSFDNVPTGQVTVRPDPTGFTVTPAQRIVTVQSGQETTGVNFDVSSIRQFPTGLQLVSLPWDYPSASPAELLGAPPASFNMAAWEPQTGQYALFPSTPADRFRLGSGYWLMLDEVRELTREGLTADDVFELPLDAGQSGWNLVGDFFQQPLDFYSLQVRDRNGVVRGMQQAMASGLVRSPLYAYQLGGYATSAVAEPYVGYWINVGADVTVIGNRLTDTLSADEEATAPAVAKPDGGWLMPLTVSSGQMSDASTLIGCAPAATDGFDAGLDMLKPPPVDLGAMVYAASKGQIGAQGVDVRADDDSTVWPMTVQGPAGQRIVVRWPDLTSVPGNVKPVLVDEAAGREIYMRTAQSYEFTAGEGSRELTIKLSGGDAALAVSTPAARSIGAGAEITYTLSADAEVEVRVLNIAGRVIDTVVTGDLQTAGAQRVTWDGVSARGTKAPGGTYLVVVRARAASGQQTQAIGTVALGR
ncbi:MAG: hypothetical protein GF393_10905, partial [Armatimonadia bacterium]|nr:hypothetical protein [Armatimonadia bacterium]